MYCVIISSTTLAQVNINKVSFDLGYTNNYQREFGNSKLFALSPEFKIGGNLIKEHFEWDVLFSFWNDGVDKPFQIRDATTYSYSSQIIGLRLNYFPKKIIIPIHFISGLSSRFIQEKYVGGTDFTGMFREDNSLFLLTFDFGLGLDVRLIQRFRIRIDGLVSLPFNKHNVLYAKGWSNSLKLGLDYFIK